MTLDVYRGRKTTIQQYNTTINTKLYCVFSLESPHRGDSNEYTQYTIFNIKKKKTTLNYPKSAAMGFFQGAQVY